MSSLLRRMQRVSKRSKPTGIPQFGSKIGVHNDAAKPRVNASRSRSKSAIPAGSYRIILP